MRLIMTLGILFASAASLHADSCFVRQRVVASKVIVQQAPVVAQVAAYAVPYAVPLYSVGYDAGAGDIRELRLAIEELRKTVQELRLGAPPVAEPKVDTLDAKAVRILGTRCASCHTGAEAKGKNVIFTEPGVLNPHVDKFMVWSLSDSGQMPPPPAQPIPDEEVRVLKEWVVQAIRKRKEESGRNWHFTPPNESKIAPKKED